MKRSAPVVVAACVAAALIALLVYGVTQQGNDSSLDKAVQQGKRPPAPDRSLPVLNGTGEESLAKLRGKVVVLNFWASWCPPCKDEAPVLARWQPRLQARNGTIVGVDVLDVSSDAQRFIEQHKLDFPQLRDGDGSTLKSFEIVGYPETIVLDRKGRIAATSRGAIDERFFVEKVQPLLKERT